MKTRKIENELFGILDKAEKLYGDREDLVSIEIGFVGDDADSTDLGLIFYVNHKQSPDELDPDELFPGAVDTLRVRVKEMPVETARMLGGRSGRLDKIQPGISISSKFSTSGTLGMIVYDKKNNYAPCILSNWHVLAKYRSLRTLGRSKSYKKGAPVYQPGKAYARLKKTNRIAKLTRYNKRLDCAIATLTDARSFMSEIYESEVHITGVREPMVGDIVEKSGVRTGVTSGYIASISRDKMTILPLPGTDPSLEISDAGDSGAVWYDKDTRLAVGLHFAGEKSERISEFARAIKMTTVVDALDISIEQEN